MFVGNAASVVGYNTNQTTLSISVLLESTRASIPGWNLCFAMFGN